MPALPSIPPLGSLVDRDPSSNSTDFHETAVLQVVCAWPVSGQYGIGSRILYYGLVAACVLARKADWLRSACLAAALLFPAVAALHAIVLAAVHVDGAVDMDVFGAFQLCSIGILAAPAMVRMSKTYFYDPGRNLIFLWTGLLLAGLLSLTVEFSRIQTYPCPRDSMGNPLNSDGSSFPYEQEDVCGLTCSIEKGPFSPMRKDAVNEIFVIPAPHRLTFSAGMLLAAACCIPAVLSLVSTWNKILEISWKTRFGNKDDERMHEPIEGTNGATMSKMSGVNDAVRMFLSTVEVPVFAAAILAILIVGELNFNSYQVRYQTEPITSVGQWTPIVGTTLAALGSLYLFFVANIQDLKDDPRSGSSTYHCNCAHHQYPPNHDQATSMHIDDSRSSSHDPADPPATRPTLSDIHGVASMETVGSTNRSGSGQDHHSEQHAIAPDAGYRRKVAKKLMVVSNYFGTASPKQFDDSEFKHGKAVDFPEIPGEAGRNPEIYRIRETYNLPRDADGNATPVLRGRSSSRTGSVTSGLNLDRSPSRSSAGSPSPSPSSPKGMSRADTLPTQQSSLDLQRFATSPAINVSRGRPRQRRDTLEVPSPVHPHFPPRNDPSTSPVPVSPSIVATRQSQESPPTIVVSSEPDESPAFHATTSASSPEG
ncbi:hypothetical protein F4779DRAFT_556070 [Xylariaceae sp. FL0662B]|nr:hypothetical protein F4779DRAFT_556070 [Xylariaceae sp. FL0662B]